LTNPFRSTIILNHPDSNSSKELQLVQKKLQDLEHQIVSLSNVTGEQLHNKGQNSKKIIKKIVKR
jgi:hypothetical protein